MQSRTKRHLAPDQLDALLRAGTGVGCRVESELSDGWFSTVYRVRLDDGRPAVVKLAPPDEAAVLRYEQGILGTEAMVYRRIADLPGGEAPIPTPIPIPIPTAELLYVGREFLVLSVVEGTTWDKAAGCLTHPAEAAARRELGAITARLHTLGARGRPVRLPGRAVRALGHRLADGVHRDGRGAPGGCRALTVPAGRAARRDTQARRRGRRRPRRGHGAQAGSLQPVAGQHLRRPRRRREPREDHRPHRPRTGLLGRPGRRTGLARFRRRRRPGQRPRRRLHRGGRKPRLRPGLPTPVGPLPALPGPAAGRRVRAPRLRPHARRVLPPHADRRRHPPPHRRPDGPITLQKQKKDA